MESTDRAGGRSHRYTSGRVEELTPAQVQALKVAGLAVLNGDADRIEIYGRSKKLGLREMRSRDTLTA